MQFVKMHGLGNDFILMEGNSVKSGDLPALARALCDRHKGIGGDGLLLYYPSGVADLLMRLFNSDGSEAPMCGNGLRCLARYAFEKGLARDENFTVETGAGLMKVKVSSSVDGVTDSVEVNMGPPYLTCTEIPVKGGGSSDFIQKPIDVSGRTYIATCLKVGNPHCVIFMESFEDLCLSEEGHAIENLSIFPLKTNVEFVKVENPGFLRVKVWERGAGETLACGTGACASLVAANLCNLASRRATVELPGGSLEIRWDDSGNIYMTGPAEEVFSGELKPRF